MSEKPERNIALELVRVTEAAAMGAARFMGRGDKIGGDGAAVDAMRLVLNSIDMDGVIVIGEGEKDEAPMLFNGETLGTGRGPKVDIAVDPIDGTRLLALGRSNALATVALADRGTMFDPGPIFYMDKIAVGPEARGAIDIEVSPLVNLRSIARSLGKDIRDLTVVVLDRPRHEKLIAEIRKAGARIRLITDGDVAPVGAPIAAIEWRRAVEQVIAPERIYIASFGSHQLNAHVHFHVHPLPPGIPVREQQMASMLLEVVGCLELTQAEWDELGQRIRAAVHIT